MNFTPLDEAYHYETYSEFIKNMQFPKYSPICIFCNFTKSTALSADGGSFRRCLRCRKDFKARIYYPNIQNKNSN